MLGFKTKTSKRIIQYSSDKQTLDMKHTEIMKNIEDEENDKLPKLMEEKKKLKRQMSRAKTELESAQYADKLDSLRVEIRAVRDHRKKYLLDNSKYIFDYFEKKVAVSAGVNRKKNLNAFFGVKGGESRVSSGEVDEKHNPSARNLNESHHYFMNTTNQLDMSKYMVDYDKCGCGGEMISMDNDGLMICNKCGVQTPFLIEHEKPSYKEPPKEVCFYAYKRLNHFKEILAQLQAKETTQIPDEIFENLRRQIKKERINVSEEDLTHAKMKDLLKKMGYNKYYEHISFIKNKLGIKPPVMSIQLEEKLITMFLETQMPYAKHCPVERLNFLNYYYVLYKLCEILDEKQYCKYCPMLKDDDKLMEQDDIWMKMCEDLNWTFIPTQRRE